MVTKSTRNDPTRTVQTEQNYRAKYRILQQQVSGSMKGDATAIDVSIWLEKEHSRLKSNTISQYRACIMQHVRDLVSRSVIAKCDVETIEMLLAFKRSNRNCTVPSRTSARKLKSVKREKFETVTTELRKRGKAEDLILADLLDLNVRLYLRPVEFQTAKIKEGYLVVKNAKATNGRATGEYRRLDLSAVTDEMREALGGLLEALRALASTDKEWKQLWGRLSSRLARICKRLGTNRICLYTTRHIGIASAKQSISSEEIAGNAGHKTTRTAAENYARKSIGWKLEDNIRPHPVSLARVETRMATKSAAGRSHLNDSVHDPVTRILGDWWFAAYEVANTGSASQGELVRFGVLHRVLKMRPEKEKVLPSQQIFTFLNLCEKVERRAKPAPGVDVVPEPFEAVYRMRR
jgi:hypothetical protein